LGILGDMSGFRGQVHIAIKTHKSDELPKLALSSSASKHPLYPISIRGGAIIGVFMIQALKGALWGT
jgi:hypothetical protein